MVHELIVGTRGSDLALAQTKLASEAIGRSCPEVHLMPRIIRTSGDEGVPLATDPGTAGRKGLFTSEIERALLAGEIDVAVHSAKDLPSELSAGTELIAVLPRAAAGDVLVTRSPSKLRALPGKAIVATGSIRRKHQLLWQRPDVTVTDLRGNVPTRLRKLHEFEWDGMILAVAGLTRLFGDMPNQRLSHDERDYFLEYLSTEIFVPAAGQGIIAMQIRSGDKRVRQVVETANDSASHLCLRAEREFLRLLQADCNCPVGAFARAENGTLSLRAQIFKGEGLAPAEAHAEGEAEPEKLAAELFHKINGN